MVILRPTRLPPRDYPVPAEIALHLRQTPWCAAILNDPSYIPLRSHSRQPPPYLTGRYTFMAKTLNTVDTVSLWQGFYRPPQSDSPSDLGEVLILFALGGGLDGHLHTAHGGVAAALLDEAMGTVGGVHKTPQMSQFTAYLHVNYRKPLKTPGVRCIRARLDGKRSAGRKMYITAELGDGEGTVFNDAEGLFLETERKHGRGKL